MSGYPRDMVVMYGCPPPEPTAPVPSWPSVTIPVQPLYQPTHDNCSKCNRHIRIGEVCPWCHADAVKEALAPKRKARKGTRTGGGSK